MVENASIKAGLSFAYNLSGAAPSPDVDATQGQIGTTYGVAYNKFTKDLFVGALLRRHTGLGPLGIGGLYKIDYSGATPVVSSFLDLEALGVDFGSIASNVDRGLFGVNTSSADSTVISKALKEGMGDVEISDDGNTLYVVNLFQRNITVIDLTAFNVTGAPITAAELSTIAMPSVTCPNGVARPFGLKYYRGGLFLSVTCTAEGAGATIADLDGYVYEYSGGSWSLKVSIPLDFKFWGSINPTLAVEDPITWTDNYLDFIDDSNPIHPVYYRIDKKQPMLSDIEFDIDGSMIIGALDRTALQFAQQNYLPGTTKYVYVYALGDVFRAAKTGSTFTLENGGIAGGVSGCGAQTNSAFPYAGPGGGEFYCGDTWVAYHNESTLGALAILPGSGQVMITAYDPIERANTGGIITMRNSNGSKVHGYQLYNTDYPDYGSLSKGHGLGDLELLCNPAPIEVGNRVWLDTDKDGVQDAGELAIAGVTVQLIQLGTVIATSITDANGNYLFSNDATRTDNDGDGVSDNIFNISQLMANMTYTVRIPNAAGASMQSVLSPYRLTSQNANNGIPNTQDNVRDSDGALVGTNAEASILISEIPITGANNHTFDFGFISCTPNYHEICNDKPDTLTLTAETGLTNVMWYDSTSNTLIGTGSSIKITSSSFGLSDTYEAYYYTGMDTAGVPVKLYCPVQVKTISCCEVTVQSTNTVCNNNGTPANTSDDWFSLTLSAIVTGGSGNYIVKIGTYTSAAKASGSSITITGNGAGGNPLLQANGTATYSITIIDNVFPICSNTVNIGPVTACSYCLNPNCFTVGVKKG
ncbi:MAG: SdrD B-like domain-containing protein [Saprospiraceae bacterium]|nr:hypothetical protein [Saprospiraceae bacterium]